MQVLEPVAMKRQLEQRIGPCVKQVRLLGWVVSNRGLIGLTKGSQWLTTCRWWQLNYFWTFSPPKIGEDEPILTSIFFQRGLVQPPTRLLVFPVKTTSKRTDTPFETRGETNPHWAGVSNMGFGEEKSLPIEKEHLLNHPPPFLGSILIFTGVTSFKIFEMWRGKVDWEMDSKWFWGKIPRCDLES